MASILSFASHRKNRGDGGVAAFTRGFSIEVMPRTAAKIDRFDAILPAGTRVYVAHLDGTPFEDMLATAKRISAEGFEVMPHFPARVIRDQAELERMIGRYADEAGIESALVLGGGLTTPKGHYDNALQLMDSGLFDRHGYRRIHVAGHPEGNRDIDTDGGERVVMEALRLKQAWRDSTDAEMAVVTQFCFEADPVIAWTRRLAEAGVTLPVHIGLAGPAKLQTLIKFAMACGVGPSLRVLQRRAADVTKLLLPFAPDEVIRGLAAERSNNPAFPIAQVHLFPLGGIKASADWARELDAGAARAATARS
ncbi:MAG: methylenetetrahydrofolate reductase [Pseudomonadota bacterium]